MVRLGWRMVVCALTLVGCNPAEGTRASLVEGSRVVALRAVPAEAPAGAEVQLQALVLGPQGPAPSPELDYAFCVARKPLTAPGLLAEECLSRTVGDGLVSLGSGAAVSGRLPEDGCAMFGPRPAPPEEGAPAMRPADPDTTGGYYQPFRVVAADSLAVGYARIACGLKVASQETALAFTLGYDLNTNPELDALVMLPEAGAPSALSAAVPLDAAAGATVTLRASWLKCPEQEACGDGYCTGTETLPVCPEDCQVPRGCTGAEQYLLQDAATLQLVERRETMRVSWFVTGGELTYDRVGRDAQDPALEVENQWTLPQQPGVYWVAAVIRDDRGGQGWLTGSIAVQ
jgi:hypothetical protein